MNLDKAIEDWTKVLGVEQIETSEGYLKSAENCTFKTDQEIPAILFPKSTTEVQECIKIANDHSIKIYPTSSGRNWGYGSRVPTESKAVLLDLRKMNKICDYNEDLAYVTVEAGVTQKQLHEYVLEKSAGKLWLDTTASSPLCSLVGNIMERGHGVSPYCDHVSLACGYEVVLGNGDIIHTGYGAFPNSNLAPLDRWGLGPSVDGLFSQSNFGIVTKVTVWLMPAPEHVELALFSVESDEDFERVYDALRPLRLDGTFKCGPHMGNVYLSLLRVMKYPWEMMDGKTPLPEDIAYRLAKEYGIGLWNGVLGLYGSKKSVQASKKVVKKVLGPLSSRLVFINKQLLFFGRALPEKRLKDAAKIYRQMTGGLTAVGVTRAYWRKSTLPPENPENVNLDSDRCGLIYLTAATPFVGKEVRSLCRDMSKIILKHGFEPNIGLFPIRDRAVHFHVSIPYDRDVEGEDEKAHACHHELKELIIKTGYMPHRLNILSMDIMKQVEPTYAKLLKEIKRVCDPNGVIAPNRYLGQDL